MYDVCICCEQCSQVPPFLPPVHPVLPLSLHPQFELRPARVHMAEWVKISEDIELHIQIHPAIAFLHSYACGSVSMVQTPPCSLAPTPIPQSPTGICVECIMCAIAAH